MIDLCGHERYLKTTIFGMTGMMPDLALVVVGANMGVQASERCVVAGSNDRDRVGGDSACGSVCVVRLYRER